MALWEAQQELGLVWKWGCALGLGSRSKCGWGVGGLSSVPPGLGVPATVPLPLPTEPLGFQQKEAAPFGLSVEPHAHPSRRAMSQEAMGVCGPP